MAQRRSQLHELLKTLADNVYFQPPENLTIVYPCIVYMRDEIDKKFADNGSYHRTTRYQVTVIDRSPDSIIVEKVADLAMCIFARHFVTENLHHDIFSLYF